MKNKIEKSLIIIFAVLFFGVISTGFTGFGDGFYAYASAEEVYLGGTPIGIIANSEGLLVSEIVNVTSSEGSYSPSLKAGVEKGDVIVAVNGEKINDVARLNDVIQKSEGTVILTLQRGNDRITVSVSPMFDLTQNAKKIGIAVKNNIAGIGTLTFVKTGGDYGALGHQITDAFGNGAPYGTGKVFFCDITGYKRPTGDAPGELLGKINLDANSVGTIDKNKFCGIFGTINEENYYSALEKIKVGGKNAVHPGKAYIVTTINESLPQKYEIEIVKASNQSKPSEKSMVLRITDEKLLSSTHGILQGMSGSPIIQDGKLIGAVTHVFTNDSTMGYGIYIDWMINEA